MMGDEGCALCGAPDTDGCECSAQPQIDVVPIASFLALMQAGGGLFGKSPAYIAEKFDRLMAGDLQSLDAERVVLFNDWCDKWHQHPTTGEKDA